MSDLLLFLVVYYVAFAFIGFTWVLTDGHAFSSRWEKLAAVFIVTPLALPVIIIAGIIAGFRGEE